MSDYWRPITDPDHLPNEHPVLVAIMRVLTRQSFLREKGPGDIACSAVPVARLLKPRLDEEGRMTINIPQARAKAEEPTSLN